MIIAANLSRKWLEFNKPQEEVNFVFTPSCNKLECCVHLFSFSEIGLRIDRHTYVCIICNGYKLWPLVAVKNIIGQVATNNSEQIY